MTHRPSPVSTRAAAAFVAVAASLATTLPAAPTASAAPRDPATFAVASFNILGSQHTEHSTRWAPGPRRARWALRWLEREKVSVVGLQEAQVDQVRVLTRDGAWRSWPPAATSTNSQTAQSVAWRPGRWELVRATSFTIPFDLDQQREQPVVLLRHRRTGRLVWVISVHLTSGGSARAVQERAVGTRRLVEVVDALETRRVPVVVTGDMNDRDALFCRVAALTSLVSPAGGWHDEDCSPPDSMRIDWIFGSPAIRWSGFRYAEDPLLATITDHTVPVVAATLGRPTGARS